MSRKNDVEDLLRAANDQYKVIREKYEKCLNDKSLDLRVPVKNLMENLRSALDYMAHDIYDACCQAGRLSSGKQDPQNIYFPYGLREDDFKAAVGRSLPDLKTHFPKIHGLLESIQPFRCNNNWLYELCSVLNEKKHERLTPQVRKETETYTVRGEHGRVTIPVNNPNVTIRSKPEAVRIFGVPAEFSDKGIRTDPSGRLKHERHKWVSFIFEGTNVNVLGLLDIAVSRIATFAEDLYSLI